MKTKRSVKIPIEAFQLNPYTFRVLCFLVANGSQSKKFIAEYLGCSRSTVHKAMNELQNLSYANDPVKIPYIEVTNIIDFYVLAYVDFLAIQKIKASGRLIAKQSKVSLPVVLKSVVRLIEGGYLQRMGKNIVPCQPDLVYAKLIGSLNLGYFSGKILHCEFPAKCTVSSLQHCTVSSLHTALSVPCKMHCEFPAKCTVSSLRTILELDPFELDPFELDPLLISFFFSPKLELKNKREFSDQTLRGTFRSIRTEYIDPRSIQSWGFSWQQKIENFSFDPKTVTHDSGFLSNNNCLTIYHIKDRTLKVDRSNSKDKDTFNCQWKIFTDGDNACARDNNNINDKGIVMVIDFDKPKNIQLDFVQEKEETPKKKRRSEKRSNLASGVQKASDVTDSPSRFEKTHQQAKYRQKRPSSEMVKLQRLDELRSWWSEPWRCDLTPLGLHSLFIEGVERLGVRFLGHFPTGVELGKWKTFLTLSVEEKIDPRVLVKVVLSVWSEVKAFHWKFAQCDCPELGDLISRDKWRLLANFYLDKLGTLYEQLKKVDVFPFENKPIFYIAYYYKHVQKDKKFSEINQLCWSDLSCECIDAQVEPYKYLDWCIENHLGEDEVCESKVFEMYLLR